jgi:photosystem II stability/assembly factor-like uncharacterized protein
MRRLYIIYRVLIGLVLCIVSSTATMSRTSQQGAINGDYKLYLPLIRAFYPVESFALSFATSDIGWLAADNYLYYSTDKASSWKKIATFPHAITAIDFVSPSAGWVLSNKRLFQTTDAGKTWKAVEANGLSITSIEFIDEKIGWIFSPYQYWATSDGGVSWRLPSTGCGNDLDEPYGPVFFQSPTSIWQLCRIIGLAGYRPNILAHTGDAGQTWQIIKGFDPQSSTALPITGFARSLFMRTDHIGWMVLANRLYAEDPDYISTIITTTDGWRSWKNLPTIPKGDVSRILFVTETQGYAISNYQGELQVWYTENNGIVWRQQALNLP